MLTYSSTNCISDTIQTTSASAASSMKPLMQFSPMIDSDTNSSSVQSPIPESSLLINNGIEKTPISNEKSQIDIEKSLVRHIRHVLPLESLRELSEEIGFEPADLQPFRKKLEVWYCKVINHTVPYLYDGC